MSENCDDQSTNGADHTFVGYNSLDQQNRSDISAVGNLDKIFLPIVVVGTAKVLLEDPQMWGLAFGGSLLLLLFWVISTTRSINNIHKRWCVMRKIESYNDVKGHESIARLPGPSQPALRVCFVIFYVVAMLCYLRFTC